MSYERFFEEADQYIQAHPHEIKFAGGVSGEWIKRAEAALGLRFSPSFDRYLRKYGGGSIGGEVINGLLGVEFEEACGPDIVYNTLLDRKQSALDPNLIVLVDNDGDELFFLDVSRIGPDAENPVVRVLIEDPAVRQPYAASFAEFLLKRIEFFAKGKLDRPRPS